MKADFNTLINETKPVLIDFSAEWCGPCKMLAPILEEVASELGSAARIIKIDVDKNPGISSKYQISSVPTLILFKDGQQLWRKSGVVPASQLIGAIKPHINE
jgi:thioredoxin 1